MAWTLWDSITEFLSPEAGQRRRDWLNEKEQGFREGLYYALGPQLAPTVENAAGLLNFTDAADVRDYVQSSRDLADSQGVWDAVGNVGRLATAGAAMLAPGVSNRVLTESQQQAQNILDLLKSGRASEVTDEMMAAADDMYLFNNYDLPMDEASRMARAREMGLGDEVYHGTTHVFDTFGGGSTRNLEGHFGAGDYFTTNAQDASKNYAGEGPDLTQRIQLRAERLADDMGLDYDDPKAVNAAKGELKGESDGLIIPARIRGNTVSVEPHTRGRPTTIEAEYPYTADDFLDYARDQLDGDADEIEIRALAGEIAQEENMMVEPEGPLGDFAKSIIRQGNEYGFDGQQALEPVQEGLLGGFIGADDLDRALRNSEELMYADGPEGELIGNEVIRQAFQDAGYPNIRMSANAQGWNMDIPEGTSHIIASNPTNIRSRFARFDPRLSHLRNLSAGAAGLGILSQFMTPEEERELEAYLNGS